MPALLLRALAVDRCRQSDSVGVDLDMKFGSLIDRFDIGPYLS